MIHLKSVQIKNVLETDRYPFNLPLIQNFQELRFNKPVTILVGDNGTGKSTLLEAIASNIGSILIGGEHIDDDPTLTAARSLSNHMKLTWKIKTQSGFFFRANDFINFTQRLKTMKEESTEALQNIRQRDPNSLEALPYARTLHDLNHAYGEGLDTRSHGESFLDLFQARFKPNGLYILDEPEAPLSPIKQLSLIAMINEMVEQDGQFIIATHSPILMAIPYANVYVIEDGTMGQRHFEDIEHVTLTKDFLNNPERFLKHLN
ncbi:AAA family ATPase [Alkalibacillus aidingensis]|uniref:AAA family ATPase n=1 Tax=Alkalibacillus aidingensis TaxID=2747607 RepID=UPI002948C000|nr:AAA family ATPase [Alkalibacillus aidingensis]